MSAWDSEFAPPRLAAFGEAVRAAFHLGPLAIGTKGDANHTYGYHRSRSWIMIDGDGDDDYSVQVPLDQGGDGNWISAIDISLDSERMAAVTGRLLEAVRAGDPRLAAVREFYGTVDGRTVVGWDTAYHRAVTADDSHLWHVHLSFYRSRADSDHADVLAVLTAEGGSMDDYGPYGKPAVVGDRTLAVMMADLWYQELADSSPFIPGRPSRRTERLARIEASLAEIRRDLARISAGNVDVQALAEALKPFIGAAVAAELARRLQE
ncbi:hypothetical protein Lfu02_31210 [Longispora fulva]|uniref:Uncharacterized protein n=1 Tax=Longispora fulva TaxID=619741 RepID=A0A8J7GKD6_9ACTN|nr:hypothetical protein [Longispora fulva]MBG6139255.1 hypothetical protein [Longispora fulva]GIG58749.1 hypothetical protein Lfu02_31210 [Longispora fulva]